MPQQRYHLRRAAIGIALLCGVFSVGAIAHARPDKPRRIALSRVALDIIPGLYGRLYCLTPSDDGPIVLRTAMVVRRTCLSTRGWAVRKVFFED